MLNKLDTLDTNRRDIASGVVVLFFQEIAADILGEPVGVELVSDRGSRSIRGRVGWDSEAGRWQILVSGHLQARGLLRCLFHELGHVLHKGQRKGSGGAWIPGTRDILTGTDTPAARVERKDIANYLRDPETEYFEQAADAYADGMTVRLWGYVANAIRSALEAYEQAEDTDRGVK